MPKFKTHVGAKVKTMVLYKFDCLSSSHIVQNDGIVCTDILTMKPLTHASFVDRGHSKSRIWAMALKSVRV